jgi:hypothetical protein
VGDWFDFERWNLGLFLVVCGGAVLLSIAAAVRGRPPRVRRLAGLAAIEEAVGRATELGRPVFFVPGTRDLDNVQTVAGLAILGQVGQLAAMHECRLLVPTDRSLVMNAARETLRAAYARAGRADGFHDDQVLYVSDDQFGYVARVDGMIARERPAACFLLGSFAADSLLLAEAGRQAGAFQVGGTAEPSQLPFLIAACDHVLIGEELFAAGAAMSGDPAELGSLRGQDIGKWIAMAAMLIGAALTTAALLTAWEPLLAARAVLLRLFAAE